MNPFVSWFGVAALAMSSTGAVSVLGEVVKSGGISIESPTPIRTVLRASAVRETADLRAVEIFDVNGAARTVDATRLDRRDYVLPGETVFVKPADSSTNVFVKGAVALAGPVPYTSGMTARQAIEAAGGASRAGMERVKLTRTENGVRKTWTVSLGDLKALQPGDLVEAPYINAETSDKQLLTIVVIGLVLILLLR